MNRLARLTNPLGKVTEYTYNPNRQLASATDYAGRATTFEYDAAGRLTRKTLPDDEVLYQYDAAGYLASVADGDSNVTFVNDLVGHVLEETQAPAGLPSATVAYTYDGRGVRTSMTAPSGMTSYAYDAAGRLRTLDNALIGAVAYEYDGAGRLANVAAAGQTPATTFSHDAAGHLASQATSWNAAPVWSATFDSLSPVGDLLTVSSGGSSKQYVYNALRELVEVHEPAAGPVTEEYSYDRAGNRLTSHLSSTYGYDVTNRLLEDDAFQYSYDDNGNLIRKLTKASGQRMDLEYDGENRLIRVAHFAVPIGGTAADEVSTGTTRWVVASHATSAPGALDTCTMG